MVVNSLVILCYVVDLNFSAKIEMHFRIRIAFSCAGCCPDVRYFGGKVALYSKDHPGWILLVASHNSFHPKINIITQRIHNNYDKKVIIKKNIVKI